MAVDFVMYAKCKHGHTVGFCTSNVPAGVMEEFCAEPSYVELVKVWKGSPQLAAGFCHACEEESRAVKAATVEQLRDLNLLGDEGQVA